MRSNRWWYTLDERLRTKQRAFLAAYSETGHIQNSANIVGISKSAHYVWLKEETSYAAEFERIKAEVSDMLEDEAWRRAHDGIKRPVLYQGEQVKIDGVPLFEHEYSDMLMVLLLKASRPDKYRERSEVHNTGAQSIKVEVSYTNANNPAGTPSPAPSPDRDNPAE